MSSSLSDERQIGGIPILNGFNHKRNDERVLEQIKALDASPGYWDFRRNAKRDAIHGVTQYPAMMVPAMQSKLMDMLCDVLGQKIRVIDPFVGSGTTLVEAMRRGLDFWGQDINPLAVLISLSKTGPFDIPGLAEAVDRVYRTSLNDSKKTLDVIFPGRDKWFDLCVSRDLSCLRRSIRKEKSLWIRRMLWVSLAETVRLTSNSRTSTFKLHIRSQEDLQTRNINAIEEFYRLSKNAVRRAHSEYETLKNHGLLKKNAYKGEARVQIGRSNESLPGRESFDLLVTSPPYGDGASTVPYGQYSFLPLQWIDLIDISDDIDPSFLASTHEIDARALGGSRKEAMKRAERVIDESPALLEYLEKLADMPRDRGARVASFFADLANVLDKISNCMRPNAYMIWTVGNRRVGGLSQPLDMILVELFEKRNCVLVDKLSRMIPNKRMANRNSISPTMRQEQVLIMRVGGNDSQR